MRPNHLGLFAAIAAMAGINLTRTLPSLQNGTTRTRRPVPTMACSSPAEIAAWNAAVDKKKMARHVRRMQARLQARKLSEAAQAHRASAVGAA